MSYDVTFEIDTGGPEPVSVADFNITSNVGGMFCMALGRKEGIKYLDGERATHALFSVEIMLAAFISDPAFFRTLNPTNGWGDSLAAYVFLTKLRDACLAHPATTVRVSA